MIDIEFSTSTTRSAKHFRKIRLALFCIFAFVFTATLAFLSTSSQPKSDAASTSGFKAGNIISDAVMSDYNSMTVAEIQAFLKSKNSCNQSAAPTAVGAIRYEDVNVTKNGITYNRRYYFNTSNGIAGGYYHVKDGHFVCLADETINGKSAAYHIWDVAQTYKINPKVLIVLLEKEQGLITDKWPYEVQYRAATGYGCPDTAACDTKYYGLESQLANAAYLFRTVLNGGWTNYPLGKNYIQYHQNKSCGGSIVNIENLATSALYRYTPYQPNAASLAAGYGTTSDGCGAYGNRNFYLYYTDWFGSTQTVSGRTVSIRTSSDSNTVVPKSALNVDGGIYTISSVTNNKFVIDVSGASMNEGGNIQLWQNNNTIAQKFLIRSAGNGYYYIENLKSSKMLAVNYNNNIIQATYSSDKHNGYLWSISGSKDAATFTSVATGLVLDVFDNKMASGTNIHGWTANNTSAQKFKLNQIAKASAIDTDQDKDKKPDLFTITSKVTNDGKRVVDIANADKTNGTNVWLWTANNTSAQNFKLDSLGNGFYRIIASTGTAADGTPMVLDVYDASSEQGTNVHIWKWNGTIAQQWLLLQNNDGTYSFISRCNGMALDVYNRSATKGTNIQIWQFNNTPAQKFNLVTN